MVTIFSVIFSSGNSGWSNGQVGQTVKLVKWSSLSNGQVGQMVKLVKWSKRPLPNGKSLGASLLSRHNSLKLAEVTSIKSRHAN